jgi:ATP phosphoribosyltransferase regulatory subunit
MTADYAPLRALLTEAGYSFVEPPIVLDASIFVELAGEDLRRRLFLTAGADGTELTLRPDYTIPVCLRHLAGGAGKRRADYADLGPVFRQRPGECCEFLQAGVESLGRTDRVAADADILKLALDAAELLGVGRPSVRIGDSGLFAALLDALDHDPSWRQRLERSFGDTERVNTLIARADSGKAVPHGAADRRVAKRQAGALLAAGGLGIAGRTADEIADRVMEKAALASGIDKRSRQILGRFLAVAGKPAEALRQVLALARRDTLDMDDAIDRFARRLDAFAAHGIAVDRLTFAADFGRRLDYYTGFVFEIHDPARGDGRQIVGGGRYDRLVSLLGHGRALPAVGFAIWLDRMGGGG